MFMPMKEVIDRGSDPPFSKLCVCLCVCCHIGYIRHITRMVPEPKFVLATGLTTNLLCWHSVLNKMLMEMFQNAEVL